MELIMANYLSNIFTSLGSGVWRESGIRSGASVGQIAIQVIVNNTIGELYKNCDKMYS